MTDDSLIPYTALPGSPVLRTLTLEQQIDWFEERVHTWIFKPAKLLLETRDETVDFAVLGILNAVPELLAKCQGYEAAYKTETFSGKKPGLSAYLYRKGIEYVFPNRLENAIDDEELYHDLIYGKLRCGLAHFAFVGERILLSRGEGSFKSIQIDNVKVGHLPNMTYSPPPLLLTVDVPEWYSQMKQRVAYYVSVLRDAGSVEQRSKFSERITRSEVSRKGAAQGCACGPLGFCNNCAEAKFPDTHLAV